MRAVWRGDRLLARRKQLGLTTAALAEKVGCKRPLISMWAHNNATPSGHFLVMLGAVLNCEPKELYDFTEE